MILHAVYLTLTEDADPSELADVMQGLAGLSDLMEGFDHGPNIDAEGKSPQTHYGFHASFKDRAALDRYAGDPRHRTLGARLVALCGGADGIMVYDLDVAP